MSNEKRNKGNLSVHGPKNQPIYVVLFPVNKENFN